MVTLRTFSPALLVTKLPPLYLPTPPYISLVSRTLRTFSLAFLVTKEHESSCAVPPMNLRMTHVTFG